MYYVCIYIYNLEEEKYDWWLVYKGYPHFPSIGSYDPPSPPLGVENVKIRDNSEKIRGPSTTH